MLANTNHRHPNDKIYDMDSIHNYYEKLVLEEIIRISERVQNGDREFLSDVACVALNRLPPRYIRHDVDMTFFMSPLELNEITDKIHSSVKTALHYVEQREEDSITKKDIQTL